MSIPFRTLFSKRDARSYFYCHHTDHWRIIVPIGGEAGALLSIVDPVALCLESLYQFLLDKESAVVVIVEKGVALKGLALTIEGIVDGADLNEELSARLKRFVHGTEQDDLLLFVDGMEGETAVRIFISFWAVAASGNKITTDEVHIGNMSGVQVVYSGFGEIQSRYL